MYRRSLLSSLAAGSLAATAGCGALDSPGGDDPSGTTSRPYDRLRTRSVYLSSDVSLGLPSGTTRVDAPDDADLLILPGTTDVGPETAIDWLAAGAGVALAGTGAQPTLVEWLESDAHAETFESDGIGVGSPPPDFLVAFGIDRQFVSTHNFTWNETSDPADERYLGALETALEEVEDR